MKKAILILICSIAFVGFSYGQTGLRVGVKGGLNFANLDTETNVDSRTGFHAGAYATIKLSKIALQPEIIFSQQGAKFQFDRNDLESNFSYLNIPVMLKLYLVGGLNLQAGPQFGFLLSADREVEDVLGNVNEEDAKDLYKSSDLSIGLGAGIDLPFGLSADARYNLGLSDINDSASAGEIKNQVFQVSVGYKLFGAGK